MQFQKKIHIVLLTDCLEDFAGGAEKQTYQLANGLDKNKYQISVISLDCQGKASPQTIQASGGHLFVFRVKRIYGLSGLIQGMHFFKFLKKSRVDILQTYHFSSDMWGTFWGRLAGVKVIISNRRDMGFWRKPWHIWAYRLMNPWVTKIVVVANAVKKMVMETEKVPAEKIVVIYNGIDIKATSDQRPATSKKQELGIQEQDKVIVHTANLKPIKGHEYLLKAISHVVQTFPDLKLVLIGKDELNGSLQKLAEDLKIKDKVLFLGQRQDVLSILTIADFCVLPSLSEGMSNAILEYMAAGKAVVVTNVGGNPELVEHGVHGLIVSKENEEELAEAILGLLKDEDRRQKMGESGFNRVQELFTLKRMTENYGHLFEMFCPTTEKILHLISSGGLYGAEKVLLSLGECSQKGGLLTYVGALRDVRHPHIEVINEAHERGLPTLILESEGRFDIRTVFRLKKYLVDTHIDILHTHNYKSDIVGFLAAKLAGKRWVATNHVWHRTDKKLAVYESLDAFFLKFADKVIAVSEEIKKDLVNKNLREQRVKVISNGIEISRFDRSIVPDDYKRSLGLSSEDFVISIIGRLSKEKGHEVFLKAVKEITPDKEHIKFLIVGDGPLQDFLSTMIKEFNLSGNVIFTGVRQDMPFIYASTDILVNSSYIEGLPMTILEAMASRVPIIATRVGGVPQVIHHGKNGILLEPGNVQELVEAIKDLMGNPSKRESLAQQAYNDVFAHFSAERMANDYREIYKEVLNSNS